MRIGFIGTGTIPSAIVSGLNASDVTAFTFLLSPRNAGVAASLASAFDNVTVAASNQAVLDGCDIVMLAVRPQVAFDVLESPRFRPDHHVISLMALIAIERVQVLVAPATRVVRAIPLPMVAARAGVMVLYPDDSTARACTGCSSMNPREMVSRNRLVHQVDDRTQHLRTIVHITRN